LCGFEFAAMLFEFDTAGSFEAAESGFRAAGTIINAMIMRPPHRTLMPILVSRVQCELDFDQAPIITELAASSASPKHCAHIASAAAEDDADDRLAAPTSEMVNAGRAATSRTKANRSFAEFAIIAPFFTRWENVALESIGASSHDPGARCDRNPASSCAPRQTSFTELGKRA
jgi:hypothetical protein